MHVKRIDISFQTLVKNIYMLLSPDMRNAPASLLYQVLGSCESACVVIHYY
jgi:hypothetical protein